MIEQISGDLVHRSFAICPVCSVEDVSSSLLKCSRCEALYHEDCWQYYGQCAIYGCVKSEPHELVSYDTPMERFLNYIQPFFRCLAWACAWVLVLTYIYIFIILVINVMEFQ